MAVRTQYAKSEGVRVAYQLIEGDGPTFLQIPGAISNMALDAQSRFSGPYYEGLSTFCRVLKFDKRGTGLSDPTPTATMEQQLADVVAVMDATDTESAAVCGMSHGGSLAILFALAYPERVSHLLLLDALCCDARDPFRPSGDDNRLSDWRMALKMMEADMNAFIKGFARVILPQGTDQDYEDLEANLLATASPAAYEAIWRGMMGMDLRPMLRHIKTPTLVLHAKGDLAVPVKHGRYLGERIAGAQYVEMDSDCHAPWFLDSTREECLAAMRAFLLGEGGEEAERIVASVLFTDIVNSTEQQRERGDSAWKKLREEFQSRTTDIVGRSKGRVVEFTGDGAMAEFSTPGDALRAAKALAADACELGVEIRAGVHAGEAYRLGDQLSGTCVNIAARVSALADASEILTTMAVQGMLEGGDFQFDDAGEHDLKGIGKRRVVRVL